MRKILCLMILVLVGLKSIGQVGQSCATYNQNRTISEMREILMQDGVYFDNLRTSYSEAVNSQTGKYSISPDKEGMKKLIDHTVMVNKDFVIPSDHLNGVRYGNSVKFTNLLGQPSDNWAAYQEDGIDYIYSKMACLNPQKNLKPYVAPKPVEVAEVHKEPYIVEEKDNRTNVDTHIIIINNTPVVEQVVQQGYDGYPQQYYPQQPRMGILGFAAAMIISNQNRGYSRPVQVNNNNYNNYNYNGGGYNQRGSTNYGSMSSGRGNTGNNNSSNQGHMSGGRSGNGSSSGGSGNGGGRGN